MPVDRWECLYKYRWRYENKHLILLFLMLILYLLKAYYDSEYISSAEIKYCFCIQHCKKHHYKSMMPRSLTALLSSRWGQALLPFQFSFLHEARFSRWRYVLQVWKVELAKGFPPLLLDVLVVNLIGLHLRHSSGLEPVQHFFQLHSTGFLSRFQMLEGRPSLAFELFRHWMVCLWAGSSLLRELSHLLF